MNKWWLDKRITRMWTAGTKLLNVSPMIVNPEIEAPSSWNRGGSRCVEFTQYKVTPQPESIRFTHPNYVRGIGLFTHRHWIMFWLNENCGTQYFRPSPEHRLIAPRHYMSPWKKNSIENIKIAVLKMDLGAIGMENSRYRIECDAKYLRCFVSRRIYRPYWIEWCCVAGIPARVKWLKSEKMERDGEREREREVNMVNSVPELIPQ